jgi:hypothetical protein
MWRPCEVNLCEWGYPACCKKVAWRLHIATYPEYYCAECAALVAAALGIEAPCNEGSDGGDGGDPQAGL